MENKLKITFTDSIDAEYVMNTLCDLLARQDPGYEYTYTLKKADEEEKNDDEC